MNLYKNIRNRRVELGMSQECLSMKVGYSDKSMISKIEKGIVDLPVSMIEPIADALQITPSELMEWDNDDIDLTKLEGLCEPLIQLLKHQDPYTEIHISVDGISVSKSIIGIPKLRGEITQQESVDTV